jgi:hypothetical protein
MSATLKDETKKTKAITVEQLKEMEAECPDLYEALDKEDPSLIK